MADRLKSYWDIPTRQNCSDPKVLNRLTAFFDDLAKLYRQHGLSLAHEDSNGSFTVELYYKDNEDRARNASVDLSEHIVTVRPEVGESYTEPRELGG